MLVRLTNAPMSPYMLKMLTFLIEEILQHYFFVSQKILTNKIEKYFNFNYSREEIQFDSVTTLSVFEA